VEAEPSGLGGTIEPLPKRPLIRDLVTDIVPEEEKFKISRKQYD
jgi:succinate dehydrogenase/fumarate reductase-like Fe-S protein